MKFRHLWGNIMMMFFFPIKTAGQSLPADGEYVLQSRVIASNSTTELPSGHHTVTVALGANRISETPLSGET
jgi:hypothetical protein